MVLIYLRTGFSLGVMWVRAGFSPCLDRVAIKWTIKMGIFEPCMIYQRTQGR